MRKTAYEKLDINTILEDRKKILSNRHFIKELLRENKIQLNYNDKMIRAKKGCK